MKAIFKLLRLCCFARVHYSYWHAVWLRDLVKFGKSSYEVVFFDSQSHYWQLADLLYDLVASKSFAFRQYITKKLDVYEFYKRDIKVKKNL